MHLWSPPLCACTVSALGSQLVEDAHLDPRDPRQSDSAKGFLLQTASSLCRKAVSGFNSGWVKVPPEEALHPQGLVGVPPCRWDTPGQVPHGVHVPSWALVACRGHLLDTALFISPSQPAVPTSVSWDHPPGESLASKPSQSGSASGKI